MRALRKPGSRCEVRQALCFRGDEEGALGEHWLAEHAATTDRESLEDGAGRGVDQVGAGVVPAGGGTRPTHTAPTRPECLCLAALDVRYTLGFL